MKKELQYSCIVETVFSLLLYLLYTDDEDGNKTFFCVSDSVGLSVAEKLPNCYYVRRPQRREDILKMRLQTLLLRLRIGKTNIFAQDHGHGVMLIGRSNYTLLEDAIGTLYMIDKENNPYWRIYFNKRNIIQKIYGRMIYGHLFYDKVLGNNKQCVNRVVTTQEAANSIFFSGHKCEVVDIFALWNNSSEIKKKFILNVFDITNDLVVSMEKATVLFLTSPLMEESKASEKDCYEILKPYYDKYKNNNICIKTHPRDKLFPYEKYFPQATVIRSRAPMQLFYMLNIKVCTVISESLSAVKGLPHSVEIKFVDFSTNKLLLERFGDLKKKYEMDNNNKTI